MNDQLFPQRDQRPQAPPKLSALATRLKLAEDRYGNLQKRTRLNEETLLAFEKDVKQDLRVLTQRTVELRRRFDELHEKLDVVFGELATVVQKHEFAVVDRYVSMWQPMRFVTQEEAKKMIQEALHGRA